MKMMTTSAMNVAMCISVIIMMMMVVSTMNAATECISVRDVPIWLCPVQELCAVPIEPGHRHHWDDDDDHDCSIIIISAI